MAFTIMNPFRKVLCPFCAEEFYPGHCAIVANLAYRNIYPGDILQERKGGFLARVFITSLKGPIYTQTLAERRCPICDNALPYNIEVAKQITIAIVGDTSSGKSHYIAACINQLKERWLPYTKYHRLSGLTPYTEREYYNIYYLPVYKHRNKLSATMTSSLPTPLIYELATQRTTFRKSVKYIHLMFYDQAGEDLSDPAMLVQYSRHVLHASGMIYLVDPNSMPAVVNSLPSYMQRTRYPWQKSPSYTLDVVVRLFERHNKQKLIRIPVAIMVSKSDLLQFIGKPISDNTILEIFRDDLSHPVKLKRKDLEIVDSQVRKVLEHFGDPFLLSMSKSFPQVHFFATSATGWPEDSEGNFPAIEPVRCLDPLLWILWKQGVSDTIEDN